MKNIPLYCLFFLGFLLPSTVYAQFRNDDSTSASSLLDEFKSKGRPFESLPNAATDPKVEELLRQLNDASATNRRDTVRALGELGTKARPAAPTLVSLLSESLIADSIKSEIIVALVKIERERIPSLVPGLANLFAGRDTQAKLHVSKVLRPTSDKSLLSEGDVEQFITRLHHAKQQASKPTNNVTLLLPPSKEVDRETALFILPGLRHNNPAVRRKTAELLEKAERRSLTSVERALLLDQGVDGFKQTIVPEAKAELEKLLRNESDPTVKSAAERALKHIQSRF